MGAAEEHLRPARLLAHIIDVRAHAIAVAEALARDQLVAAQQRLGASGLLDSLFHRLQHFLAVDRLLAGHRVGNQQQLGAGNRGIHGQTLSFGLSWSWFSWSAFKWSAFKWSSFNWSWSGLRRSPRS